MTRQEPNSLVDQLPSIAKQFDEIWNKNLDKTYVSRDFVRLVKKFTIEQQLELDMNIRKDHAPPQEPTRDYSSSTSLDQIGRSAQENGTDDDQLQFVSVGDETHATTSNTTCDDQQDKLSCQLEDRPFHPVPIHLPAEADDLDLITENLNALATLLNEDIDTDKEGDISSELEPLIDISDFKQRVKSTDEPSSFERFLIEFYPPSSRTVKLLRLFDQAFMLVLLGTLGQCLYLGASMRCKDVRGSWYVHCRKYRARAPGHYSIVHRRQEQLLKVVDNVRFENLFKFEWQMEIHFDSYEINYIKDIELSVLSIDWSTADDQTQDREKQENLFFEYFGRDPKITDLKVHLSRKRKSAEMQPSQGIEKRNKKARTCLGIF